MSPQTAQVQLTAPHSPRIRALEFDRLAVDGTSMHVSLSHDDQTVLTLSAAFDGYASPDLAAAQFLSVAQDVVSLLALCVGVPFEITPHTLRVDLGGGLTLSRGGTTLHLQPYTGELSGQQANDVARLIGDISLSPLTQDLLQRYQLSLREPDRLLVDAYYFLTKIEDSAGGRRQAAGRYKIEYAVLRKLGELSSTAGDTLTARKASTRPLSPQESAWLVAALQEIVIRLGTAGGDGILDMTALPSLDTQDNGRATPT